MDPELDAHSGSDAQAGARWPDAPGNPRIIPWKPPLSVELQAELPQYHVHEVLGRGGMGVVYRGWQKTLERYVAIKVLPADVDDSDGTDGRNFVERFKQEAKTMARLSHPAIVPVYDAGETSSGLLYFVMELVEGTDVDHLVRSNGPLAPEHALAIASNVCDALDYAHKHGVIHRDIKASNVMINTEGRVMVTDFGVAKVGNYDLARQTQGLILGTPEYMAPEQRDGAADHRSDIYSVGVLLYEMLTGRLPLGAFDPPSHKAPVDTRLDQVVIKALQQEPDRRYQRASEMRVDVERIRTSTLQALGDGVSGLEPIISDLTPRSPSALFVRSSNVTSPPPNPSAQTSVTEVLGVPEEEEAPEEVMPQRRWHALHRVWLSAALFMLLAAGCFITWSAARQPLSFTTVVKPGPNPIPEEAIGWVSQWKGDGTAADTQGRHDGVLIGGASYAAGREGMAFSLPGGNSEVLVPSSPAWDLGKNDFSIELWASFLGNDKAAQALVACDEGAGHSRKWIFGYADGALRWHTEGSKPELINSAPVHIDPGRWYHLALVRSSDELRFYVNGEEISRAVSSVPTPNPNAPLTIGNAEDKFPFRGLLSDVRIYSRSLKGAEIGR